MILRGNTFLFNEFDQLLVPELAAEEKLTDAPYLHSIMSLALDEASEDYHLENILDKTLYDPQDIGRAQASARLFAVHQMLQKFEEIVAPRFIDDWLSTIPDLKLEE